MHHICECMGYGGVKKLHTRGTFLARVREYDYFNVKIYDFIMY